MLTGRTSVKFIADRGIFVTFVLMGNYGWILMLSNEGTVILSENRTWQAMYLQKLLDAGDKQ